MRRELLLVVIAACSKAGEDAEHEEKAAPVHVTCAPVTSQLVDDIVEVDGVIAPPPKLDAIISAPIAGRVAEVAVEEGDHVAAGALLAVIEDPSLPAGNVEARAGVASAKAADEAAKQELARQTRLVESGIGARKDLDEARAKAAAASADLDAAGARQNLASQRFARRELRAPHAGVVLHVWKRAGESVDGTTATPVAEVADTSTLEVRGQVTAQTLVKLHDGLHATVKTIAADSVTATVARVSPAVDSASLLGTVRIALDGANAPVGSAATARIVVAQRKGIVVPVSAIRRSAIGSDEIVVCEKSAAAVRTVTLGTRTEKTVEVTSGLKDQDRVVVDHVLGIDDGAGLVTE